MKNLICNIKGQKVTLINVVSLEQWLGDRTDIWARCGELLVGRYILCFDCVKNKKTEPCQKRFIINTFYGQDESPTAVLENGEVFYLDNLEVEWI